MAELFTRSKNKKRKAAKVIYIAITLTINYRDELMHLAKGADRLVEMSAKETEIITETNQPGATLCRRHTR